MGKFHHGVKGWASLVLDRVVDFTHIVTLISVEAVAYLLPPRLGNRRTEYE
jgi:hypothetical protein